MTNYKISLSDYSPMMRNQMCVLIGEKANELGYRGYMFRCGDMYVYSDNSTFQDIYVIDFLRLKQHTMEKKYRLKKDVSTPECYYSAGRVATEDEWRKSNLIYLVKCENNPEWFEEVKEEKLEAKVRHDYDYPIEKSSIPIIEIKVKSNELAFRLNNYLNETALPLFEKMK